MYFIAYWFKPRERTHSHSPGAMLNSFTHEDPISWQEDCNKTHNDGDYTLVSWKELTIAEEALVNKMGTL